MKQYTVYMHISPSNKRYIGITSTTVEKRWGNGNGYRQNKYFTRAINKYGWDNFQHIIIAKDLTEDVAKWLEMELIKIWNTTNSDNGYNLTKGGESANGLVHTEKAKEKMSKARKGKKCGVDNPMYGKQHTEKAKEKMSKARVGKYCGKDNPMYGMCGELNPMYGTCYELSPNATKVVAIIDDKPFMIFDCIKRGAEYFNCDSSAISKCCRKKYKNCGKYNGHKIVWRYLEVIEL